MGDLPRRLVAAVGERPWAEVLDLESFLRRCMAVMQLDGLHPGPVGYWLATSKTPGTS